MIIGMLNFKVCAKIWTLAEQFALSRLKFLFDTTALIESSLAILSAHFKWVRKL